MPINAHRGYAAFFITPSTTFGYISGEGRHYAIDFESSNGVRVNGTKIAAPQPLEDGDVIHIGGTLIVYSAQGSPDAQRVTEILRKHGEGRHKTELEN